MVIPIGKPGKDESETISYRPIALTSNMCKVMERMVTDRFTYIVESRNMISPSQSGFRRGRTTMDPVLCLENIVRPGKQGDGRLDAIFFLC